MRVEVLGGVERRRRWSHDEKMRIVEETLAPGAKVTEVARRNGVAASVVFTWRGADRRERSRRSGHVLRRCRLPRRRKRAGKLRSYRPRMTGGCGWYRRPGPG